MNTRHQSRKGNRLEQINRNKNILEYRQSGKGLYIFRNKNYDSTLSLPKPALAIKINNEWHDKVGDNKTVPPRGEWKGDNYFLQMVGREATIVKTLENPGQDILQEATVKDEKLNEDNQEKEKLILDQPDTVTTEGKVEHVVDDDKQKQLNEGPSKDKDKDVLINEDPLDGVDILLD